MGKREELMRTLREFGDEELRKRIIELQREIFGWKALTKIEGKTNPAKIRALKKEIARVKTILREREVTKQREMTKENQTG